MPDAFSEEPGTILAKAGAGIAVRVLDSSLREVASGTGTLKLAVAAGLYMIEWLSAGVTIESLVRVRPGETEDIVPPLAESQPAAEPGRSPWPEASLVTYAVDALLSSEKERGAAVIVIVATDPDMSPTQAGTDIRLIDRRDVAMRSSTKDLPPLPSRDGEALRCYRVTPGRYRLLFGSVTGQTLEQSVPALPGRQTVLFLKAGKARLLIAESGRFVEGTGEGFYPERSVAISIAGDEEDERIRERVRLAGVLLHDLANDTGSLSSSFIGILDDPRTDPLLKLYGALVALRCLELGRSPALDEPWPGEEGRRRTAFRRRWTENAVRWIGSPQRRGMPADAIAAWWRIEATMRQARGFEVPHQVPKRIDAPPMTECAWRWAIARSFLDDAAVPESAILTAAGRSAGGTAPWLCWQAAAAKAKPFELPRGTSRDVGELIVQVSARAKALIAAARESADDSVRPPVDPFESFSPDLLATAIRVANFSPEREGTKRRKLDDWVELAISLSLPAPLLRRRLVRTRELIDEAFAGLKKTPARRSLKARSAASVLAAEAAPGLQQRITVPDDLQKGRFGGKSEAGGFRASARFEKTKSKNWTRIFVRVEGKDAPEGTIVHFYLHDSFPSITRTSELRDGSVEIKLTAWGGFTVGVWVPERGVQLELDLSQAADAPKNIRTR